jgi:hypothetical protein
MSALPRNLDPQVQGESVTLAKEQPMNAVPEKSLIVVEERAREAARLPVPTVSADASALMKIIDRAAMDPNFDVAKLEKLLAVRDQWESGEARKAFNAAFADFKSEAVKIVKRTEIKDGPLKGKFHANLFDVVDATTPHLSKHGLTISWKLTKDEPAWMEVTCTLRHVGGHSESVSMGGAPDAGPGRNAIQARGSAKSYLERYTATAILGLAAQDADNDGNGGGGKRMPEQPAADHLAAIDAAANEQELLQVYGAAHKAAIDAEDMGALRLFTEHKDARKKAIGRKQ